MSPSLTDFRTVGRTGLRVSPLALGTMTFGDPSWGADAVTSTEILARYLDAGGNFIDTANRYSDGASETVIGEYLAKNPHLRDRLVIASKFALTMDPADPNNGGTSRKAIRRHIHDSLTRLGTDYLDLYWQHNWDRHTPLEETISTLDDLVREGTVRYVGLSDTPAWPWPGWPPWRSGVAGPRSPPSSSSTTCWSVLRRGSSSAPPANSASASCRGAHWPTAC